jgi:hypothetical protein
MTIEQLVGVLHCFVVFRAVTTVASAVLLVLRLCTSFILKHNAALRSQAKACGLCCDHLRFGQPCWFAALLCWPVLHAGAILKAYLKLVPLPDRDAKKPCFYEA